MHQFALSHRAYIMNRGKKKKSSQETFSLKSPEKEVRDTGFKQVILLKSFASIGRSCCPNQSSMNRGGEVGTTSPEEQPGGQVRAHWKLIIPMGE